MVGAFVGAVGVAVGFLDGADEGDVVGASVTTVVRVGSFVVLDGDADGERLGASVGTAEGVAVGEFVGAIVLSQQAL